MHSKCKINTNDSAKYLGNTIEQILTNVNWSKSLSISRSYVL